MATAKGNDEEGGERVDMAKYESLTFTELVARCYNDEVQKGELKGENKRARERIAALEEEVPDNALLEMLKIASRWVMPHTKNSAQAKHWIAKYNELIDQQRGGE